MSYEDYVEKPTGDRFSEVAELAARQREAEQYVEQCQKELKRAQEQLRDIAEGELPNLMDELGLSEFKTTDGTKIIVSEKIRAGISKDRAPAAMAWLRQHGHSRLIKHTVSVEFDKDEDERAQQLLEELQLGEFEAEDRQVVHPQTLQAFVRQKLEAGEDVPLELFGVHRQRITKIK